MKGIIGRKMGMTQIFDEMGEVIPVTVIQAGPCYVTQVKTEETDGYNAVQLGFEEVPPRKLNLPLVGHLKRAGVPALRYLREFRTKDAAQYRPGQKVTVEVFSPGDHVDVVGTSKGRGFAGGVKRHGFGGGPKTHGQSDRHRAPGSVSSGTTPGRVWKGKRMAGHMGNRRVTAQNLTIVRVDVGRNLLVVRGPVPGPRNGLVVVKEARKQG
ncbi:MAG: 50S ribosomal protein L3 [Anaerolineae bacterium]